MAIRTIITDEDDILRKKSRVIDTFDLKLHQLLDDMCDTMRKADGVGLAAVQVGILKRVVIVEVDDVLYELVNPEIIERSGSQCDMEGCLSSPNVYGDIIRPENLTVTAQNRDGKVYTIKASGLLARAVCHEVDHLNGVLFKDHTDDLYTLEKREN